MKQLEIDIVMPGAETEVGGALSWQCSNQRIARAKSSSGQSKWNCAIVEVDSKGLAAIICNLKL
ncbi:hypothetical protein Pint_06644 [Pistacia integerrima]|uniref:Uncharacterized protein n=1 Tax=Pistacia integerrima TaxID=434235 RepID=A0ACC0Z0Q4_9ROSI|nr:hypothetical protein Pint_06644 [Pistacia integerrima]